MAHSVKIATQIPPPLSMANRFRISKARKEQLKAAAGVRLAELRKASEQAPADELFDDQVVKLLHLSEQELNELRKWINSESNQVILQMLAESE